MRFHLFQTFDNNTMRAERICHQVSQYGEIFGLDESIDNYMSLTAADVMEAGQTILSQEPVIVTVGPLRQMPKFPAIRARLAERRGVTA
jgi:hypothetical protein